MMYFTKKEPLSKGHNSSYETTVKQKLAEILHDTNSPTDPLVNKKRLLAIIKGTSVLGNPWLGQLMARL